MDATWFQVAASLTVALLGSGGIISLIRVRRARRGGLPRSEADPALIPAHEAMASYYKAELDAAKSELRNEISASRAEQKKEVDALRRRVDHLRRLREIDASYIDALEAHIWQGNPPPPPARPQYPGEVYDE